MPLCNRFISLLLAAPLLLTACDSADDGPAGFTVTIENVSTPGTVNTGRVMGTVPLSPPVFAVFSGRNPMFQTGEFANSGTERIAEDGSPDEMVALLSASPNVSASGAAPSPGGPDDGPALAAGESVTFTFTASPGDRLQIETMFVQSNDWFYGFTGAGLDLFNGDAPISNVVTGRLALYDAGTEQDTPPGTGPNQKPVQNPAALDVGPAESVEVRRAATRHPEYAIPPNDAVIKVTISGSRD